MTASYTVGQVVIERFGDGDSAEETESRIIESDGKTVTTDSGYEYDAVTGMRINRAEPYRSIRDTVKRKP